MSLAYSAGADDGAIHVAWLDGRREREHLLTEILTHQSAADSNFEIYYRRREDSGSGWTREVLLSKGIDFVRIQWVDYCNMIVYSPNLSLILALPSYPSQAIPLLHCLPNTEISRNNKSGLGIKSNRLTFPWIHSNGRIFPNARFQEFTNVQT